MQKMWEEKSRDHTLTFSGNSRAEDSAKRRAFSSINFFSDSLSDRSCKGTNKRATKESDQNNVKFHDIRLFN